MDPPFNGTTDSLWVIFGAVYSSGYVVERIQFTSFPLSHQGRLLLSCQSRAAEGLFFQVAAIERILLKKRGKSDGGGGKIQCQNVGKRH
jgi:hypothetical protein